MELNELIHEIARERDGALKKLYDMYGVAFYAICASMLTGEENIIAAASEAFAYIKKMSPSFEDNMNAEYWIFEILYKVCKSNKTINAEKASSAPDNKSGKSINSYGGAYKIETEAIISACTQLTASDIASIMGKRRSAVAAIIKNKMHEAQNALQTIRLSGHDYWEQVSACDEPSDAESEKGGQAKKRAGRQWHKRIIAAAVLVAFLSAAVLVVIKLSQNNYAADKDQDQLGESILLQYNTHTAMTEINDTFYYCGKDGAFYKRNMATGAVQKISDDTPMELLNDGKYVYYRNKTDGFMYRIDAAAETGEKHKLCDAPGTSMYIYDGFLYFSSTGGIYRIPSDGAAFDDAELILDTSYDTNLYCVDMAADESGNIFFASGVGKGIHHITDYNGEPSVDGIFLDEAYVVQIDSGKLYFDYKDISGKITLYCLTLDDYYTFLENKGSKRVWPQPASSSSGSDIILSTGAFYAFGGNVYYAANAGGTEKSALYVLNADGLSEKLTDMAGGKRDMYITEIYASEKYVYCYCSDGKSGGDSMLFAYSIADGSRVDIF